MPAFSVLQEREHQLAVFVATHVRRLENFRTPPTNARDVTAIEDDLVALAACAAFQTVEAIFFCGAGVDRIAIDAVANDEQTIERDARGGEAEQRTTVHFAPT